MILYDPCLYQLINMYSNLKNVGIAEKAFFENNQSVMSQIINNRIELSIYDKLFTYLIVSRNIPPKMLRMIFHTGGIVFGGSLRDYCLKIKPDPFSDVDFVINNRALEFIKEDFSDKFIFSKYNHSQDYPLEVKVNDKDYWFKVVSCRSKESGKKIIDFIAIFDCPTFQLGRLPFQNLVIRGLLLKKGNYDINRLYWFPGKKDISCVMPYDDRCISVNKVLTVDGLGNPEEHIPRVSIRRTIKLLKREYYLFEKNWVLFFERKGSAKHRYFLVNDWRKRHWEILGYLYLKMNSDVITNILPFLVEWNTIVKWTINQLLDSIECPWLILPDDIRSIPQIIKLVNNCGNHPITREQLKKTILTYQTSQRS